MSDAAIPSFDQSMMRSGDEARRDHALKMAMWFVSQHPKFAEELPALTKTFERYLREGEFGKKEEAQLLSLVRKESA